ncbi:10143_t:CDS:2 [Ambispora gerdemannii]|uniref:10143_t:CDS:1 n=1 Tax=Ambispora gerdemannii TaxID=144530 RepID=A0A9N9EDC0_9GLOM|nr:10143_t:CDS:2 [Ambispora gerdemannii]
MNSHQDIKETQELNDLEELYTVFYAIKDPGPYAKDKNITEAVIKWLNRKGMTQPQLYRLLSKQADDATYACILGLLYHYGIGVQVDHSMAFVCYGYAAESSNDAFAQNQAYNNGNLSSTQRLVHCHRNGDGTPRDPHKALYLAKKDPNIFRSILSAW